MAKKDLNRVFLSASVPYPHRDAKFYNSADPIAIRDAIRALATVIIPKTHLFWGGHPAVTPLIREIMSRMDSNIQDHVSLYQSEFFSDQFIEENSYFRKVHLIEAKADRQQSLIAKREAMLKGHDFIAGVFIGGMEGVLEEYEMFKRFNPNAYTFPIASTGAAARMIYDQHNFDNERLLTDYAYMNLFKDLFHLLLT